MPLLVIPKTGIHIALTLMDIKKENRPFQEIRRLSEMERV